MKRLYSESEVFFGRWFNRNHWKIVALDKIKIQVDRSCNFNVMFLSRLIYYSALKFIWYSKRFIRFYCINEWIRLSDIIFIGHIIIHWRWFDFFVLCESHWKMWWRLFYAVIPWSMKFKGFSAASSDEQISPGGRIEKFLIEKCISVRENVVVQMLKCHMLKCAFAKAVC